MSTASTDGLEFKSQFLTTDELNGRLRHLLPENEGSTGPLDLSRDFVAPQHERDPTWSVMAALLTAFGEVLGSESSRAIHPVWMTMARQLKEDDEERIASFFQPVTFNWNRDLQRIRKAARGYSEKTDADY